MASAVERLATAGLRPIERERWVGSPVPEQSETLLQRISGRLDAASSSGDIEGLQIVDPSSKVRYYRGRWRAPVVGDTGDFMARRPQAYGADLWCAVRLVNGTATKLAEFPIDNPVIPGRDEAWRLQMAIDATRGAPQQFALEPFSSGDAVIVKFFSPIPGFAERYLQLIGLSLETSGALFAYRVPIGAMPSLMQLFNDMLWMTTISVEGTP
ncbi:hypothetical protein [Agromyces atrinae]|uniref:Uncharacterized protein n=1 Tax=Agromyces atrinae TaxID=592376 RepID=A0A4Q2MAH4_9MICO|nr:hypothetical protein [Agromyces atrinae]NYD68707.1 hypothetical protein [Agromyces atrinae]RXZ86070.1 hypothetical protein ESP50_12785 [Agromyces atrinae]